MKHFTTIDDDIWISDGDAVQWFGMPYTTRMTVIRLTDGRLWVHSPGKICDGLLEEIKTLGMVSYLISPNKIHHLFMKDWVDAFPQAQSYASPGLREKRKDIVFDKDLSFVAEPEWAEEINQIIFKGSSVMEEVVFFHKKTQTLILTDLIENFSPDHFSGYKKILAILTGIISPNGKTPIDWRLSFIFGKKQARKSLAIMMGWNPQKIIISHGECIYSDAIKFLERSFAWVGR